MPPIHQRIAPVRVLDIVRTLCEMPFYIADNLAHVRVIRVRQLGLFLAENIDDVPARLVAHGLVST